ncbi:uncharacterized protein LOC143184162, partial [Calliopsis andreniformis]|uniref:uncharacterized protein LOC143184162 n=1 Tax=Calliopsis andreniformis TaxID=337506 RepID=UPI003FCCB0E7
MADKRIRKDFSLCSDRHKRRIVQHYLKDIESKNNHSRQSLQNEIRQRTDEESVTLNQLPTQSHFLECNNGSDNELNNLQEVYESCGDSNEDDEDLQQLLDEDNVYYHSVVHQDSSSDESDSVIDYNEPDSQTLRMDLSNWALENNITHKAINELLRIFLSYMPKCLLPKDARTLLKTPRTINCTKIQGGDYLHFGVGQILNSYVEMYVQANVSREHIDLSFNIDGLPLSRASSNSFWPILVADNIFKRIEMVGIYYGHKKPQSSNEFLEKFIDEMTYYINNGFMYNNSKITISLSKIICDAPAKSFALYTKGHTGFSSCSKCTIVGKLINKTICFPYTEVSAKLRTDENFVRQNDEEYHRGTTSLLKVPGIGLVSNVPLDYMHLICLGVVKKMLLLWMKGPLSVRIGGQATNSISDELIFVGNCIPREFSRKPRSLIEVLYWKATEFRQFLLYTSPIVLRPVLQKKVYEHFLTLHVAVTILVSPTLINTKQNIKYAEDLLKYFVQHFDQVYGEQYISHNVHNLLHVCNDVRKFGVLDNFSAFPYENFLGSLKKLLRKSEKPLQQLARRYGEIQQRSVLKTSSILEKYCLKGSHHNGPLLHIFTNTTVKQYKILQSHGFYINCDDIKNNCFMMMDGTIIQISNIILIQTGEICKQYCRSAANTILQEYSVAMNIVGSLPPEYYTAMWVQPCRNVVGSLPPKYCTAMWVQPCRNVVGSLPPAYCTALWVQPCRNVVRSLPPKYCTAMWVQPCRNVVGSLSPEYCMA